MVSTLPHIRLLWRAFKQYGHPSTEILIYFDSGWGPRISSFQKLLTCSKPYAWPLGVVGGRKCGHTSEAGIHAHQTQDSAKGVFYWDYGFHSPEGLKMHLGNLSIHDSPKGKLRCGWSSLVLYFLRVEFPLPNTLPEIRVLMATLSPTPSFSAFTPHYQFGNELPWITEQQACQLKKP